MEYDVFERIIKFFFQIFGREMSEGIIALAFVLFVLLFFWGRRRNKTSKWRKEQLKRLINDNGYGKFTTKLQRWLYIHTWLQVDSPSEHDEPSMAENQDLRTNTKAIKFFLNNVFKNENDDSPYYCILGGSGMGKSTFVVNLIWRYIHKYKESSLPLPIYFINCGVNNNCDKSLFDEINEITNKKGSILILDALDENNEAICNYGDFKKELINSIHDFRIVIITCRTQFFENYEDELDVDAVSRDQFSKKARKFKKYYISPFQKKEINRFLYKKYLFRPWSRNKAKKIVNGCTQLMARPLLLSFIDELLKSDITDSRFSIVDIYDILIEKWLQREADFAKDSDKEIKDYKERLLAFSTDLALCMAKPSYRKEEMDDVIKKHNPDSFFVDKNLKGRSLLNRDSEYVYKFAHKSFMEFLVAKQLSDSLTDNPNQLFSIDLVSNNQILDFYSFMIAQKTIEKNRTLGVLFKDDNMSITISPWDICGIVVNDDITDAKARLFWAFYKLLLEYESINNVEIDIDCRIDFAALYNKEYADLKPNNKTQFVSIELHNSGFRDASLLYVLDSLTKSIRNNTHLLIIFDIFDLRLLKFPDYRLIAFLCKLEEENIEVILKIGGEEFHFHGFQKSKDGPYGFVLSGFAPPEGVVVNYSQLMEKRIMDFFVASDPIDKAKDYFINFEDDNITSLDLFFSEIKIDLPKLYFYYNTGMGICSTYIKGEYHVHEIQKRPYGRKKN